MKRVLSLMLALFPLSIPAVIITGQQISPTEWTYTVTYEQYDNYAVCPPPGDIAVITLSGLAGVITATAPTSTDIDTATLNSTTIEFFNSINLTWVAEVLDHGTTVRWTHFGPGTGNWSVPLHVFGFRVVTAAPAISGAVQAVTEGFSVDVSICPIQPAYDRNFTGTVNGPVAIPVMQLPIDIGPGVLPNKIAIHSRGTIRVAILSVPGFEAGTQVNPASLTFGHTGNEQSLALTPVALDVNRDGLLDLVCHFRTGLCAFQRGDKLGILKGNTRDGVPIQGQDSIAVTGYDSSRRATARRGWSRP